ncbi:MAG TPA: phosphate ABC transporter permease subunit PstC [Kouleothrix sp.]|uniref:phosphate ABC transporter permease subunit PstC n=1 Tax=Kouleothrix sp. TaxID=2779161 RepID=UPI002B5087C6|nr:phosphate ABC transporter permease subunit PstC [Kouleothrix sp.]HRC74367.1 phosphate ABC transporter permease subunit PstC [Kouleothrix sp.]
MAQSEALNTGFWRRLSRRTQHGDGLFYLGTLLFALVVIGMVAAIGLVTFNGSALARSEFGLSFLTGREWKPVDTDVRPATFGAWPAVYGTLVSAAIAVLLAAPIGIGIGIFLSELCPRWLRTPLSFTVELLAAIPSVIYGLWGVAVFAPVFRDAVAKPVSRSLGQVIPALAGPVAVGRGMMVAGVVLAIMILPTIAAITRDVLAVVPNTQREVMLALGATRWEVIWQSVLPYARAGVIGGVMLGLGRALGETMAATMLIGNSQRLSSSLFAPGVTAASLVASELTNANSPLHESALIEVALVLFGITLMLNLFARLLVWQVSRGPAGARI